MLFQSIQTETSLDSRREAKSKQANPRRTLEKSDWGISKAMAAVIGPTNMVTAADPATADYLYGRDHIRAGDPT